MTETTNLRNSKLPVSITFSRASRANAEHLEVASDRFDDATQIAFEEVVAKLHEACGTSPSKPNEFFKPAGL